MSATCPHCQAHFPKSETINARHKAACSGWQAELGTTKPRDCLCGYEATSLTQMKRHRSACSTWKARDRGEVQMARLAETLQVNHGEGVTNPRHVDEGEAKRKATLLERYGAENVFAKESSLFDAVQAASAPHRPILRGDANPFARPEVQAKIRATNLERYGVKNPRQVLEVRNRTQTTNLERYGVGETLASPSVREKGVRTNLQKYGQTHHMKNRDFLTRFFEKAGRPGPNLLEARFASLNPELLYTGNGAFWRWLPKLGHHKNPDFILPGPDPEHPKKGVTHVVEVFGDFWHSRMFTGRANFDHEQELVEAYAEQGIKCLIVWESEFDQSLTDVRQRVTAFLS